MRRSVFSTYYLEENDFSFEDGKIRARNYDKILGTYLLYFGIDYLKKIFFNEEFTTEFLKKILPLYINEQQETIVKIQKSIDNAQGFLLGLNRQRIKK